MKKIINFQHNGYGCLIIDAAFLNSYEVFKLLIEYGANPFIISLRKKIYNCLFYLLSESSIKLYSSEDNLYKIIKLCIEKLKKIMLIY